MSTLATTNIKHPSSASNNIVLDSSARVGIGTTSPQYALDVSGSIQMTNTNALRAYNAAGSSSIRLLTFGADDNLYLGGNEANANQNTIFRTNSSERARITSDGKLLVGTSTSAGISRLTVRGNTSSNDGLFEVGHALGYASISSGDSVGIVRFSEATNSGIYAQIVAQADAASGNNDYPGRLVFSVTSDGASSPTERMRITSAGYIKASNNGSYVSVAGAEHEFRNSSSGSATARFHHAGTANDEYGLSVTTANDQNASATYFLRCAGSSTERATIRTNGGLANYSANNSNLSDRNTKKDISPAADTWDCIKEWEIVNYRYKDQPDDADLNVGVIAQQVAESCPEVITVFSEAKDAKPAVLDDDGNEVEPAQEAQPEKLGVKEQQMYWMAIKALQEAQVRIEQLEQTQDRLLQILNDNGLMS